MWPIIGWRNCRTRSADRCKGKLQLLPFHFASSSRQTAKVGAFPYVAGEFCCLSQDRARRSASPSNFFNRNRPRARPRPRPCYCGQSENLEEASYNKLALTKSRPYHAPTEEPLESSPPAMLKLITAMALPLFIAEKLAIHSNFDAITFRVR